MNKKRLHAALRSGAIRVNGRHVARREFFVKRGECELSIGGNTNALAYGAKASSAWSALEGQAKILLLRLAPPSRGGLTGLAGVPTRPAGYPSDGVQASCREVASTC